MPQHVRLRAGSAVFSALALGTAVLGPIGAANADPTYTVSGSITPSADTPDDHLEIAVYQNDVDGEGLSEVDVNTGVDGSSDGSLVYHVDGLAAGTYRFCLYYPAQDEQLGCYTTDGSKTDVYGASDVNVASDLTGKDFALADRGTVSGAVTNPDGSASDDASVVFSRQDASGEYHYSAQADLAVGDAGLYSLKLLPGRYIAQLYPDSESPYVGEFYGGANTDDEEHATPIDVSSSGEVQQINLSLLNELDYDTAPSITGGPATVGRSLRAEPGTWSDACAPTFGYAWWSVADSGQSEMSGEEHQVATTRDYTPTAADTGRYLYVVVTATAAHCTTGVAYADSTAKVVAPVTTTSSRPTPTQPAFDGATLAAATGKAKPGGTLAAPLLPDLPADAQVAYQWFEVSKSGHGHKVKVRAIKGAHGKTYKVKKKDKGSQLFVTMTVRSASYAHPAKVSSKKVRVH